MILKIKSLCKSYGSLVALSNLDIEFTKGIHAVLGPNGAGKSTLIKIITSIIKADSGSIYYNGKEIKKNDRSFMSILGYVPQFNCLYEEFSLYRYLSYIAILKGIKKSEIDDAVNSAINITNLNDKKDKKISTLSGGMKKRLMIAQAIINDPEIIILDEPTAALDPLQRVQIRNLISKMSKEKIIIIATHIVGDIESIADNILLLNKGEELRFDIPLNLLDEIKENVFTINTKAEKVEEIEEEFIVSSIKQNKDKFDIRVVSKKTPDNFNYKNTYPDLTDVYLYHFEMD